jgi:hypothetical protein
VASLCSLFAPDLLKLLCFWNFMSLIVDTGISHKAAPAPSISTGILLSRVLPLQICAALWIIRFPHALPTT